MKRPLALLLCSACGLSWRAGAQPSDAPVPATIPRVEIAPIAPVAKVAPVEKKGDVAPVVPPSVSIGAVSPVTAIPVGVAPAPDVARISGANIAAPAKSMEVEVNVAALKMPSLVNEMRAGTLTPADAWQKGEMSEDDVRYYLQAGADEWLIHNTDADGEADGERATHRELVRLLIVKRAHAVGQPVAAGVGAATGSVALVGRRLLRAPTQRRRRGADARRHFGRVQNARCHRNADDPSGRRAHRVDAARRGTLGASGPNLRAREPNARRWA